MRISGSPVVRDSEILCFKTYPSTTFMNLSFSRSAVLAVETYIMYSIEREPTMYLFSSSGQFIVKSIGRIREVKPRPFSDNVKNSYYFSALYRVSCFFLECDIGFACLHKCLLTPFSPVYREKKSFSRFILVNTYIYHRCLFIRLPLFFTTI